MLAGAADLAADRGGITQMRVTVLGPLTVTDCGGTILPAGDLPRRARQVLAVLAARHDRIQTKDALADAVWGAELPGNHVATLEHYVSMIRRRLQPDGSVSNWFIVTRGGGYLFDTGRAELDLAELRGHIRSLDALPPDGPDRLAVHSSILTLALASCRSRRTRTPNGPSRPAPRCSSPRWTPCWRWPGPPCPTIPRGRCGWRRRRSGSARSSNRVTRRR
nr:hypothetical protein GCM10020092_071590 [Actinoplanes digitatis]